jgi:hypothetical protein
MRKAFKMELTGAKSKSNNTRADQHGVFLLVSPRHAI